MKLNSATVAISAALLAGVHAEEAANDAAASVPELPTFTVR
jgi:hypothetical protein